MDGLGSAKESMISHANGQFLGKVMPDDTAVSCAKMAKPVEIPLGLWTQVGPRKHVADGAPDLRRSNFYEKEHVVACPMTLFSEPCRSG